MESTRFEAGNDHDASIKAHDNPSAPPLQGGNLFGELAQSATSAAPNYHSKVRHDIVSRVISPFENRRRLVKREGLEKGTRHQKKVFHFLTEGRIRRQIVVGTSAAAAGPRPVEVKLVKPGKENRQRCTRVEGHTRRGQRVVRSPFNFGDASSISRRGIRKQPAKRRHSTLYPCRCHEFLLGRPCSVDWQTYALGSTIATWHMSSGDPCSARPRHKTHCALSPTRKCRGESKGCSLVAGFHGP